MSDEHLIGEGVLDSLIADEDDVSGETLARILGALRSSHGLGMRFLQAIQDWALAIQRNAPPLVERHYFVSELDGRQLYTCYCPGCGAYLKRLEAGVDEGTDAEWCGACRY